MITSALTISASRRLGACDFFVKPHLHLEQLDKRLRGCCTIDARTSTTKRIAVEL